MPHERVKIVPQSLSRVIVHIVFSTKDRKFFMDSSISSRLHAYLATVIRDMDAQAYRVGGTDNHVHIACSLPRTISQSDFLRKIKISSSKWIKDQGGVCYIGLRFAHPMLV